MSAPFQLAGYELLGKIGSGGMSTVWKARQLSLDRLVAIKTLSAEYLPDAAAWQRFRLEATASARLSHPGIVQVYDAGEVEGIPYIVMEYVDGRPVGDLLANGARLPEAQALHIATSIARALGYAWDKDCIIHCDIKPDNVLLTNDGHVKVVDLGLARFIGLHRRASGSDELIVGTPNYTAPEQAQGLSDLDCRADIYALGASLYHMVTGQLPFAGSAGSSAMDRHMNEFLPDPMELNPELSAGCAWLIEKMMIKDRAFRPPYWSTVEADITAVEQGRWPNPPLPEAGQSTVARCARRLQAPADGERPRAPRITVKAPPPRKRWVVNEAELETRASAIQTRSSGFRRALFQSLVLLATAIAVYAFFFMGLASRIGRRPVEAPQATAPAGPTELEAEAEPTPPPAEDQPDAPHESVRRGDKITWSNADFQRGARAYNEAIRLFNQYQATRSDRTLLARIEALALEAARAFETCRPEAPAELDMEGYIHTAYQLIATVRHSTLMDDAEPTSAPTQNSEKPLPAPNSSLAPAAAPPRAEPAGLTLSPLWNKMPLAARPVWEDLRKLLQPVGVPAVQLEPQPNLALVGQVTYLMPAPEAARALGVTLGAKRPVEAPGFPDRSFSYYGMRGDFGDGFDQAVLVVDGADRVAALQLSSEKTAPLRLKSALFRADWRAYNFVLGKMKGRKDWSIAHRVQTQDRLVVVESELAEPDPFQVHGLGQSKERVLLYLPQPVANLILARLEKAN